MGKKDWSPFDYPKEPEELPFTRGFWKKTQTEFDLFKADPDKGRKIKSGKMARTDFNLFE